MKRDTYLLLAGFHREALLSVAVVVADLAVLCCTAVGYLLPTSSTTPTEEKRDVGPAGRIANGW